MNIKLTRKEQKEIEKYRRFRRNRYRREKHISLTKAGIARSVNGQRLGLRTRLGMNGESTENIKLSNGIVCR
jgi:hypothetical protein